MPGKPASQPADYTGSFLSLNQGKPGRQDGEARKVRAMSDLILPGDSEGEIFPQESPHEHAVAVGLVY